MKLLYILAAAAVTTALELTPENWDEKTAGKTVFIKFLAPWWGHCKAMKPAWDKLMAEDFGPDALVADVDCTAAGEQLCEEVGVEGYPTIKYGDPEDKEGLEDYDGGRDFEELVAFAKENLKPMCSVKNIDLCDDEKKAEINKLLAMSEEELQKMVDAKQKILDDAEEKFEEEVEKLQERYEELQEELDDLEEEVKNSGFKLMKSVLASKKKPAETSKDEL